MTETATRLIAAIPLTVMTGMPLRVLIVLSLSAPAVAEQGVLVVHVMDVKERAVDGLVLSAKGDSSTSAPTAAGKTRIRLPTGTRPGTWVSLQLVAHNGGKDFVFISPWDGRLRVPPFENDAENFGPVVLAEKGDKLMLQSGEAVAAIVARTLRSAPLQVNNNETMKAQREAALEAVAQEYGLRRDEMDTAIRAWAERAKSPYQRGMAALYSHNYHEASTKLAEALARNEQDYADNSFFLGQALYGEGKYADAEAAYRKAYVARPDDPVILNAMALALVGMGKYNAAAPLFERAIEITEETRGADNRDFAAMLDNMAEVYRARGKLDQAESLYRRALEISTKVLGPDHPDVGVILDNFARLYTTQRKYTEALPLIQQALAITEKAHGPDNPDVAITLNNLAGVYLAQYRFDEAEPIYRRVIRIKERALGPDHPSLAITLTNLASLLSMQKKYDEAEPLYTRALQISDKRLGSSHRDLAIILDHLANLYTERERYAEAEPLFMRALHIKEAVLGPDHPDVASVLYELCGSFAGQRAYEKAEPFCTRSLEIMEKALGSDHPHVLVVLINLADLYDIQRKYKQSEPLYKRALAVGETVWPPGDPQIDALRERLRNGPKR